MLIAEAAAAAINRRLSAEVKESLAKHNGRVVALTLPGRRLVFVIGERGELRAASPLIQADAEITPFAESNNGNNESEADNIRITGNAKLLEALQTAWKECADIQSALAKITGAQMAADITAATKTLIKECKTTLTTHFITQEELKTFKQKTQTYTTRKKQPR